MFALPIRGYHPLRPCFPDRFWLSHIYDWPGPRSLATTSGVSVDVLSSRYLDVSVPWVFIGHPGIEARDAAPPGLSQPSTPEFLTTPRHPPRALGGLTTPIGPPRPGKDAGRRAVSPDSHASRFLAMPGPGARPRRLATRKSARRPLPIQRVRSQSSPHRCGVKLCVEYATHLVPGPRRLARRLDDRDRSQGSCQ